MHQRFCAIDTGIHWFPHLQRRLATKRLEKGHPPIVVERNISGRHKCQHRRGERYGVGNRITFPAFDKIALVSHEIENHLGDFVVCKRGKRLVEFRANLANHAVLLTNGRNRVDKIVRTARIGIFRHALSFTQRVRQTLSMPLRWDMGVRFPQTVKRGPIVIKIHRRGGNYVVEYPVADRTKEIAFDDFKSAKAEAELLASTGAEMMTLTAIDRAGYLRAKQVLARIGVPVELAAVEFAHAKERLGDTSLSSVIDFYLSRRRPSKPEKNIETIIEELLESKRRDGLSEIYLEALEHVLNLFASRFKGYLSQVSGVEVDAWLRRSKWSARTRNNVRAGIVTLVNFAKRKRYLPREWDEMDAVPVLREPPLDIAIFTPAEMIELLRFSHPKLVAFFAIGAFAGVRHAEIKRMEWEDVWLEKGYLLVGATKAKHASQRLVPITPNLREWLLEYRKAEGPICEFIKTPNRIHDVVVKINQARWRKWQAAHRGQHASESAKDEFDLFTWKKNVLRHSFISYRLADTQNLDQVALEAGCTRQIIFNYYRQLVTPESAKEWFEITPAKVK